MVTGNSESVGTMLLEPEKEAEDQTEPEVEGSRLISKTMKGLRVTENHSANRASQPRYRTSLKVKEL